MRKSVFIFFVIQSLVFTAQTTDANGKKQGYWKKKDEKTNKLIYEGQFKDDKPVGKFKYYYPNDSVRAVMLFKSDGKSSFVRLYHMNGKRMAEGKYIGKEAKDSTWNYYDESGALISKENYLTGKKNGMSYVYLPDGKLSEERNYKLDVQDGPFKQYFDGKNLKGQGTYVNGQLDGRVVYYFPNGTEVAAGFYKNGVKNGPWIYREENGKIKEKELFKNGKQANKKETDAFFSKNKPKEAAVPETKEQKK